MYPTPLRRPQKVQRKRRKPVVLSLIMLVTAGAYSAITIMQPFAELQPAVARTNLSVTTPAANLPWPSYGQGALGLADGTVVASNGSQTEKVSMASTAKIVTALVILDKYPLAAGASGPSATMSQADVNLYNRYIAMNGSVMGVYAGQKLTERQMLQGIMLPSANNIADSLAVWGFGSVDNYLDYANKFLARKGLTNTSVAVDASGYDVASVSTTTDLVKIGALAMSNPSLAEIVAQKSVNIPGTGLITNYNGLIGKNAIVGVKTGNNDANGGVFVGAAKFNVSGKTVTLISALSGANTLSQVLRDSGTLLAAAPTTFTSTTIVKKDAVLASYRQTNGNLLQAKAADDLVIFAVRGQKVKARVTAQPISYSTKIGDVVGSVTVEATEFTSSQKTNIILKQKPVKPDIAYRLLHP